MARKVCVSVFASMQAEAMGSRGTREDNEGACRRSNKKARSYYKQGMSSLFVENHSQDHIRDVGSHTQIILTNVQSSKGTKGFILSGFRTEMGTVATDGRTNPKRCGEVHRSITLNSKRHKGAKH